MESLIQNIQKALFMGAAFLFTFQSILLFIRSHNSQPRRTLAYVFSIFALPYIYKAIQFNFYSPEITYGYLREEVILGGSFFIALMYIFPIKVLVPGWLNWKKKLLLFSPIIMLSLVYLSVMHGMNMQAEVLESYSQILHSFWHFNVWFRIFYLICNIIIITLLMIGIRCYEKKYKEWINNNLSNHEFVDISWMKWYVLTIIAVTICYMGTLFIEGRIPVIIHTAVLMSGFSFIFYKGLFYESPYPMDFHMNISNTESKQTAPEEYNDNMSFESRIPSYVETVKEWLKHERPYLYKDFKLTDVGSILPLNRSYLSRVFNEGFGKTFSEVIREYRIEYSKELMIKNPTLPMNSIAEMSGFNSDSTFIRAFKKTCGITPALYKVQEAESEN